MGLFLWYRSEDLEGVQSAGSPETKSEISCIPQIMLSSVFCKQVLDVCFCPKRLPDTRLRYRFTKVSHCICSSPRMPCSVLEICSFPPCLFQVNFPIRIHPLVWFSIVCFVLFIVLPRLACAQEILPPEPSVVDGTTSVHTTMPCSVLFLVQGMDLSVLNVLGKCSITELPIPLPPAA
jgi:hypothetical protein